MRFALAACALALLAGCDGSEVVDTRGGPTAEAEPTQSEPHGDLACDDATLAGIDETVRGQLAAFAAGDYGTALGFASEGFRAGMTAEQFEATVTDEYPLLVGAEGHASSYCVVQGEQAQVLVTIDGTGDATDELVYALVREGGAWRIAGAGHVQSEEPIEV